MGSEFLRGRNEWFRGLHELIGEGDVGGITDVIIRARVKGDATVVLPVGVVLPSKGNALSSHLASVVPGNRQGSRCKCGVEGAILGWDPWTVRGHGATITVVM